jgi:tripartite-type tricarboxylate transporter receptor subunit TctC
MMRFRFAGSHAAHAAHTALAALAALAVCAAVAAPATAQNKPDTYPGAPIKLIVPFAPGGFTDVVARLVAEKLTPALGQPVIVENRMGAGSTIGTDYVAKSAPDGYTLGLISTTHVIAPWLYKKLPYDAIKSFAPITKLVDSPYVLVINPSVPAKSVSELIALAKARPGHLDYASSGNGSSQHLAAALFATMADIKINHVPYRGSGQALNDIIGGQVSMGFLGVTAALPQIAGGRLRALAVTTTERSPDLPQVPTLDEAGLKGYEATIWLGLIAPAGTPKPILDKLHDATAKVLQEPESRKALAGAGLELSLTSEDAFGELLKTESAKWGKVVRDTGASVN